MSQATMIVITGLPCSGKTSIARELSRLLELPMLSRDFIKESLFDSLGFSDRGWSKKLGAASYSLLFSLCEEQLKHGKSFIVESNFSSQFDERTFNSLQKQYRPRSFVIECECDGELLLSRFIERSNSQERHPGHGDSENIEEFREMLLSGKVDSLNFEAIRINLNTSNFKELDLNCVVNDLGEI